MYSNSPIDGEFSPLTKRSYLGYERDDVINDTNSLEDSLISLTEKIESLQQQVIVLQENQSITDDKYSKVKQDNANLLIKIHALEEQLRDIEIQGEERRQQEERRFKNVMARQEREKTYECDEYISRIYSLQQELLESRQESLKYQSTCEKLKNEKSELSSQLAARSEEIDSLKEDIIKLREISRLKSQEDEKTYYRTIELLSIEMEQIRKNQASDVSKNSSNTELKEIRLYVEIEQELQKLKKENNLLREANEELQAQLLASHLEEGRSLLREEESSLAEELDNLSVEPLRKALKEQNECNKKLRAYIDGILLNIVENHPQLLEVKRK